MARHALAAEAIAIDLHLMQDTALSKDGQAGGSGHTGSSGLPSMVPEPGACSIWLLEHHCNCSRKEGCGCKAVAAPSEFEDWHASNGISCWNGNNHGRHDYRSLLAALPPTEGRPSTLQNMWSDNANNGYQTLFLIIIFHLTFNL